MQKYPKSILERVAIFGVMMNTETFSTTSSSSTTKTSWSKVRLLTTLPNSTSGSSWPVSSTKWCSAEYRWTIFSRIWRDTKGSWSRLSASSTTWTKSPNWGSKMLTFWPTFLWNWPGLKKAPWRRPNEKTIWRTESQRRLWKDSPSSGSGLLGTEILSRKDSQRPNFRNKTMMKGEEEII